MDKMRWRYGDTNPVIAAVDANTVIEIGDMLYHGTGVTGHKASVPAADLSLQAAREEFADNFLGIAMQRSRKGDTDPIRVGTTGVFEFDCEPCAFELGDLIGPRLTGASDGHLGGRLASQVVEPVAGKSCAIGRVSRREPLPTFSVLVDIRSTIMTGGITGR